jgi:dihydroorotase
LEAAARGVIFDVGHGRGSFDWRVADAAVAQGFLPQTISSDVHRYNVNGPVFDLVTTASKFLHLGLPLHEVIARVTSVPAQVIRQAELGTLGVGAWGDATLLELEHGEFAFRDSQGQTRTGTQRLTVKAVIKNGQVYYT